MGPLLAAVLVVALFIAALLLSGARGVGLFALPLLAFVPVVLIPSRAWEGSARPARD